MTSDFMEDLGRNGRMLIVLPLFTIAIALHFAALFTQGKRSVRGAGFYRIVFFFPQIISTVIVAILWSYVYTPNIGLAQWRARRGRRSKVCSRSGWAMKA